MTVTFARTDFTRQTYQAQPGHHPATAGSPWCLNVDAHPVGLCRTDVGHLVTDAIDVQVSVEADGPCLGVAVFGDEDVVQLTVEQVRLIASWLSLAADLTESRRQSGATT